MEGKGLYRYPGSRPFEDIDSDRRLFFGRERLAGTPPMILPLQMLFFEDLTVGMTETLRKVIDSSDVVGFAEVTGDRNPIHLSEHFAAKTPFGTRIAHGLYTASLISAVLGTRLPGPGAVYISQPPASCPGPSVNNLPGFHN